MSGWSGPIATTEPGRGAGHPVAGAGRTAGVAACLAAGFTMIGLALLAVPAHAEATLKGVGRVVTMPLDLAVDPATQACGLNFHMADDAFLPPLKAAGIDAAPLDGAAPATVDHPALYLVPEIVTLHRTADDSCVSWVAIRAQASYRLSLPPTMVASTVAVTFWHAGELIQSPADEHEKAVADAFTRFADGFVRQWRLDNRKP